ncbi:Fis family transcriptional regulator [Prauserella muralis]|uniref:Fis family transcriptional regulator n=1 Tax=Prauserella muralis TaxID=588067 RepID=A0A2V4B4Z0_9PSEU|nr:Fis family transcriptional regulator [Prauserella muralis]
MPREDDGVLAEARIRFLTSEPVQPEEVRGPILTSWWRSRQAEVPADRIEVPYLGEEGLDAAWVRNARPLLEQVAEQLDGQPVSLILTDPDGVVLSQHTGDSDLHRHLESVHLVPGFSYGEQFVGTNGIGTALEDVRPRHVFGHEHYAEHLENLACAAVPIQHPLSGKMIGAVDLTCWRRDASGLLIALARSTAQQIRQALLSMTSAHELDLFQAYLQACRRTSGVVIALTEDVVMLNDNARRLLEPMDQSMLQRQARELLAERDRTSVDLALPSGSRIRLHWRPLTAKTGGTVFGGVLHGELVEAEEELDGGSHPLPMFLPGTVGAAPVWLRCCHEVDAAFDSGEWLALVGEPGTGKTTLAQCVHQRRRPGERLRTLDTAHAAEPGWLDQVRAALDRPAAALVIRHVDKLGTPAANALASVLSEVRTLHRGAVPWVAVTLSPGADTHPSLSELLTLVPRTVQVPPLRYRIEDLNQLVPFLLNKLSHGGQLTCSQGAMKLLMRATWPGNVSELAGVLRDVVQHRRRTGEIRPGDLPAAYHTVTRRALTHLESIERDAIVRSLHDADGDKSKAARYLGMSRATIYRKIHDYGIVTGSRSR